MSGFRKNLIGQQFGLLQVIEYDHMSLNSKSYWKCLCDCGINKIIRGNDMITGKTLSCGCLRRKNSLGVRKDLSNLIFGKLTVINRYSNHLPVSYLCNCECGRDSIVQYSNLVNNVTKSCGNCGHFINGQLVSYKQIELQSLIGQGILNFKSCNKFIDIALVSQGKKIAIEYDEWYWHKDKKDRDINRVKELLNQGWSVITIRAKNNLPYKQQISNALNYIANNNGKIWYIITLEGWPK